jgi:molecular chaperone HscB
LFALLGVKPAIVLDLDDLEAKFRHRQRSLHPDLYTLKPPREQELSAAASAAVNIAYQALKKPMSRLRYVLELEGNAVLSEGAGGGGSISDPSFLMEIMDLRETIEDCTSQTELKRIDARNQERIQSALGLVEKHYAARDIDALALEAVKLQYFTKIEEEIEEAIAEL